MPLFVAEFQFRHNKCENADIWGKAIKLMTLRPNWNRDRVLPLHQLPVTMSKPAAPQKSECSP